MRNLRLLASIVLLLACVTALQADNRRVFRVYTASDGLADNSAQTIKCTMTGRMTITTIGNINFYDGASFSYISSDLEHKYMLDNYNGGYHLYYDRLHHLWLKDNHSVTCVNLTTERFISNMDSLYATLGMEGRVKDLFIDQEGDVWLCGPDFIQDARMKKRVPLDKRLNLQDAEVYNKKDLLLFYEDGSVVCYDIDSGKKRYQSRAYEGEAIRKYGATTVLQHYQEGVFQIRNGEGGSILLFFDAQQREWTTIMETSERTLNNMALHNDVLYIAASEGYYTYNIKNGTMTHEPVLTLAGGRRLSTDVNAVEFDRQGGMWIGTERRGLLYSRPLDAPFTSLNMDHPDAVRYTNMMGEMHGIDEFNGKKANVMFIDSRRWTWVGTSAGLFLYKSPQAEPILLNRNSGLLNDVIHAIIEDNMHNLWVSTSCGITCMQIADGDIKYVTSFDRADNVPNEAFVDGKAMRLEDGSIVMQTIDHVLVFNPAEFNSLLSQQPMVMYPKLTSMLINGTYVNVGTEINGKVILDKAITRTSEINLNYDLNTITLTFSALNFARPLQTFYRVRVRELGEDWQTYSYYNSGGLVDRRGLLHLPLVDLNPGTYHIELQASNVIDKWVGEPYTWVINIHEPWWRRSVLIGGLLTFLLALIAINFFLYNRNTRLRVQRSSNEGDMVRRIQNFAERCDEYNNEEIGIAHYDPNAVSSDNEAELSKEFIDMMVIVLPYVKEQNGKFTIRELVDLTGTDVSTFFQIISSNLYKSPRSLTRVMRLMQVQEMLCNTSKSVEEISVECHFASPNCLISSFFHQFRMTPRDYRLSI